MNVNMLYISFKAEEAYAIPFMRCMFQDKKIVAPHKITEKYH